jgi:hypothetical protein
MTNLKIFPHNVASENFGDTLEKTCETQMRHNTLFANHCPMDSIQGLQQSGLREPPYQNNDGEK